MSQVTINQIAQKAGVSRGTVDRALHDRPGISPIARDHVLNIAKLLGYPIGTEILNKKVRRFGIILPGENWFDHYLKEEWYRGIHDAQKLLSPLGYMLKVTECVTSRNSEILAAISKMREEHIDSLILTARDNPYIREMINSLVSEGVIVITYNSDINCQRKMYVGQDPYVSGRVAGDVLRKYIHIDTSILIIVGNLNFHGHRMRLQGFLDRMKETGITEKYMFIKESYNEYHQTFSIVEEAFSNHPDIEAIYMANESLPGCVDALEQLSLKRHVIVVGNDLTAGTRQMLSEGSVDFVIDQDIYLQGYLPPILAKKIFETPDAKVSNESVRHIRVINRETVFPESLPG